jgi:hypothetical protein
MKKAFMNLNRFELDPLSSDLAALENEVDPPKRRRTLTMYVRNDWRSHAHRLDGYFRLPTPGSTHVEWKPDGKHLLLANTKSKDQKIFERDALAAKTFMELRKDFETALPTGSSFTDPSQLNLFTAYMRIASQENKQGIENALGDLKNQLSWSEKTRLLQVIGGEGLLRYDGARANGGGGGTSIPYENILLNFHKSVEIPPPEDDPDAEPTTLHVNLGVCRDIALAQTQAGHQLGFKHAYSLSHVSGGGHALSIFQNPENPKELLAIDYSELTVSQLREGSRALTRDRDDTLRYTVADYSGKTVAAIPAELGTLMTEGQGMNLRTVDPFLTRPQGSIARLSLSQRDSEYEYLKSRRGKSPKSKTKLEDGFNANVFTGVTSAKQKIVGVGLTAGLGNPEEDVLAGSASGGLGYVRKNSRDYGENTYQSLQSQLYQTVYLNTPWIDLKKASSNGARLQVRGTSQSTGYLGGAIAGLEDGGATTSGRRDILPEVGAEARFRSADGKTVLKGRAANQYGFGPKDVSAGGASSGFYQNISYARVTGETTALPKNLRATFDAAVGLREFGPQILTQANLRNDEKGWQAGAGYQGALEKDAFTIAPGMEREFFLMYEREFSHNLVATANYQQPIGFSIANASFQAGVKGTIPLQERGPKRSRKKRPYNPVRK